PRLDLRARARCHLHPRTDLAHQGALVAAGAAQRGQRERAGVVRARDPGGEEVVLEHGDPAAGHLLVEGAVLQVVLVLALLELVLGAVPGRAVEAVGLRLGEPGLDHRRHPYQLPVDVALPGCVALVVHLVATLHRVRPPGARIGPPDARAARAVPL